MRFKQPARASLLRASLLITLLVAAGVRADTGSDWLAKVPPPPKDLDQAKAQCGEGVSYDVQPWNKFEKDRGAAEDKLQKTMQAKMQDPNYQNEMMSQAMDMSDPGAAMAMQQYAQYQASLGSQAPGVTTDSFFTPPYNDAKDAVDGIVKQQTAKLKKCPTQNSEAGPYPIPSCEKPIDAAAEKAKADAVNKYLAAVNKAWPQYVKGTQDYFKKLGTVPQGVDPNNYQVKLQHDNIPSLELGSVKDVAKAAEDACNNANNLKSELPNLD